jgi:hypothetical protein
MRAHECAFLGSKVFPALAGSGLCNSEPTSGRDTSKATPLKTSLPIEGARAMSAKVDSSGFLKRVPSFDAPLHCRSS